MQSQLTQSFDGNCCCSILIPWTQVNKLMGQMREGFCECAGEQGCDCDGDADADAE